MKRYSIGKYLHSNHRSKTWYIFLDCYSDQMTKEIAYQPGVGREGGYIYLCLIRKRKRKSRSILTSTAREICQFLKQNLSEACALELQFQVLLHKSP